MYQSLVNEAIIPEELLWNGTPANRMGDYDQLMEVIDWDLNTNPNKLGTRFMKPKPELQVDEMQSTGFMDKWV